MGSIQRKERLKKELSNQILEVSMGILQTEGWQAISIRKVAEAIEYTAPAVYSYFENKEAILIALAQQGFIRLNKLTEKKMSEAGNNGQEKLGALLTTMVDFARQDNELYHLMYAMGKNVFDVDKAFPPLAKFISVFKTEMLDYLKAESISNQVFKVNYLLCISFVHGFITIQGFYKDTDLATQNLVLERGVKGVLESMTKT